MGLVSAYGAYMTFKGQMSVIKTISTVQFFCVWYFQWNAPLSHVSKHLLLMYFSLNRAAALIFKDEKLTHSFRQPLSYNTAALFQLSSRQCNFIIHILIVWMFVLCVCACVCESLPLSLCRDYSHGLVNALGLHKCELENFTISKTQITPGHIKSNIHAADAHRHSKTCARRDTCVCTLSSYNIYELILICFFSPFSLHDYREVFVVCAFE